MEEYATLICVGTVITVMFMGGIMGILALRKINKLDRELEEFKDYVEFRYQKSYKETERCFYYKNDVNSHFG